MAVSSNVTDSYLGLFSADPEERQCAITQVSDALCHGNMDTFETLCSLSNMSKMWVSGGV